MSPPERVTPEKRTARQPVRFPVFGSDPIRAGVFYMIAAVRAMRPDRSASDQAGLPDHAVLPLGLAILSPVPDLCAVLEKYLDNVSTLLLQSNVQGCLAFHVFCAHHRTLLD